MNFKKLVKSDFFSYLALMLAAFMLSTLPVFAAWTENRYQVTLVDLVLPLIICFATSLVLALVFFKSFKKNKLAGLIVIVIGTLVFGPDFDSRLTEIKPIFQAIIPLGNSSKIPSIIYSLIFILVIIGVIFLFVRWIDRLTTRKKWPIEVFAKAVIIVISVAFILQLYPVARAIVVEWPQFFYRPAKISAVATTTNSKPDIYYIVLDRYTSQSVLSSQFNYDNSDFIKFLSANNFSIDPNAVANYPFTTMSIASTMNADYDSDMVKKFSSSSMQTTEPYHDSIRYASVIEKLKSLGYTYDQLGTWYEASNQAPLADNNYQPEGRLTILNQTFTLNNFSKDNLTRSLYWQFVSRGLTIGKLKILSYSSIGESDATLYKLNQLNNIAAEPAGGKFVFAHILVPHDPYYFNSDGSLSTTPGDNNLGQPVKEKYIGQVEFINSQMKNLIQEVRKNSNNQAVVIIQSDEGPYPMELNGENFNYASVGDELDTGDMTKWSDTDLKMKYGILAAYNIPAANKNDFAVAGNSVNIFRLVLNTYFKTDLPYLPECSYAYTNGREQAFAYFDISTRLSGKDNPACPADSKF